MRMPSTWVGISGYSYNHWQGMFYPSDLPKSHRRKSAAAQFNAIEINGSFYGMITTKAWIRYREVASDHPFRWAVKGNRYITHTRRMKDRAALANFFATGVLELGASMGPILWHVPPRTAWHPDVFRQFLEWLPKDSDAAYRLARHHDSKVEEPHLTGAYDGPLTHVMEIRSEHLMAEPEVFDMLAEYDVGFALTDSAGSWPYAEEITAPLVYCRLHGHRATYTSRYTDEELDAWAERARAWMAGRQWKDPVRVTNRPLDRRRHDVYFFFDNDGQGHAPFDARRLAERLGAVPPTGEDHDWLFARAPTSTN
jgi:uncharacterized protein YecE (DUF72 family)